MSNFKLRFAGQIEKTLKKNISVFTHSFLKQLADIYIITGYTNAPYAPENEKPKRKKLLKKKPISTFSDGLYI